MKSSPDRKVSFLLRRIATLWSLGGSHDPRSLLGQGKSDFVNLPSFSGCPDDSVSQSSLCLLGFFCHTERRQNCPELITLPTRVAFLSDELSPQKGFCV